MTDLVKLGGETCKICGRKRGPDGCQNPGWDSFGTIACLRTALANETNRAKLLKVEVAALGSQLLDVQRDCIAANARADAAEKQLHDIFYGEESS